MNTQEALQAIRSKAALKPVYLVLGTENYLQNEIREAFLKKANTTTEEDLNFASFDMEETEIEEVIAEAETLPFFGDHRLIFVENPYFLTAEKKTASNALNSDAFLRYLSNPLETTILVIFASYEKLDERKKVTKELKKTAVKIDVQPPKEEEIRRYVQQLFENEQIEVKRDAFDQFLRLTDFNLTKIMTEFKKLSVYVGDSTSITSEIINDLIPKTLEHNIFDMTNYVLSGKAEQALRLFEDLNLQGEETIKINAILLNQLRLLLQTKILMEIGYQQANIANTLGVHPYRVKLAMQQVRKLKTYRLSEIYDELVENDYVIKTGKADKNLLFQLFVLKISREVRL